MTPRDERASYDAVLVGGGLQNAMIALGLLASRGPRIRLALVERGERIGGNHTWCFHANDLPARARPFLEPLIEHRWPGYDVVFPRSRRRVDAGYAGLSSAHLAAVVTDAFATSPGSRLLLGTEAARISAHEVVLASGRELSAELVVDARGPSTRPAVGEAGFQKFVGRELELTGPHGLDRPTVMDATVAQRDGFHFVYALPLGSDRVLVEDTYFSDTPELDRPRLRDEIEAWVERRGWRVARLVREEEGVLPMPWTGRLADVTDGPLVGGYRGGWLHPATGYSFPVAARLAAVVASVPTAELRPKLAELAKTLRPQLRFARRLNRLLFHWFLPENRRPTFERFYRLPESTIRRFYALRTTRYDRVRMLVGRPPRGISLKARLTAAERLHAPSSC